MSGGDPIRGGPSVVLSPGAARPLCLGAIRPVAAHRPSVWGGSEQWPRVKKGGHRAGQSRPLTALQCASVASAVTGVDDARLPSGAVRG